MGSNGPPAPPGGAGAGANSDTSPGEFITTDGKGTAASHPGRPTQPFLVAPTTGSSFNTLGLDIISVACLSLPDVLFDFDSSFPHADAAVLLAQLGPLRAKHKNAKGQLPPLSVFGHADPVGKDDYNKQLSGRRARAIYGLLTHDLKIWDALFNEEWSAKGVLPGLRKNLGAPASRTKDQLFQDFMNRLFPTPVAKTEFLAGGADPKGIGDVQGCSDFNPLVVLSTAENKALSKADRDDANKTDRRVVVFIFRPGPKISPAKWPCPAATEGTAKCRVQFFVGPPAGDERRKVGPVHKDFSKTKDTFACRFYDRVARLSPCEDPVPPPILRVNPLILFAISQSTVTTATAASAQSFVSAAAPTTGAVTPVQDIVLVKKPYTNPQRAPVVLKTDKPFDGSGVLTVGNQSTILLFPTISGKVPLSFNGTDNKFSGAQLNPAGPGVTLFAEGKTASGSMKDFVMTLKLSGGAKKPGPDAVGRMTAIELLLDICAPRVNATTAPVPLPQAPATPAATPNDKFFLGRPITIQDAPKIQERAMLMVQPVATSGFSALGKQLVLVHTGTNVTTFTQETPPLTGPDVVVAPRHTLFSTSTPTTFFVEGTAKSNSARDNTYLLGIDGLDGDGDRVTVTVVPSEIVSNRKLPELHLVARVPEKPPPVTISTAFLTAPRIIGRNYPIELRPFILLATPTAFQWRSQTGGAPVTLTQPTSQVLKLTSTGLSLKENDTFIEVLVTSNLGQFLRRHRFTVVNVTIDPVSTFDTIFAGADLNQIRNPAGLVILTGADVSDVKKVAKIEMIHFPVPPTATTATVPEALGIQPNLTFTDDDDRIAWWIVGNDGSEYTGQAAFREDEAAKRGTKIHVFGTQAGDVLIQPYSGGFGYGMFRANVVPLKQVKYRANRIFIKAKPAAGGKPPVIAREPTTPHGDIRNFIEIMNVYLRQAGIELIPDNSAFIPSAATDTSPALKALDAKIVAITPSGTGHFDVEVNDPNLTFQCSQANQNRAIELNARNSVITFAFIHSMVPPPGLAPNTIVLASANRFPVNHAPQPRRDPPRNYTRPSYTLSDTGSPSSSLIPKDGIPPNAPGGTVKLVVVPPVFIQWQPNNPPARDLNLLWGVIVPTLNTEGILPTPSVPPTPAQIGSRNQRYASIIAHETGHVLGLGHRNGRAVDIFRDGLTIPTDLNIMNPGNNPPSTQNLDIIQVRAIRFSEVLNRNP